MSLFKGNLDSGGKFTAQDDVRGLSLIAPSTAPSYISLETADGIKWYMFINDSDEWIMHTSAPTAGTAGVGNIITGAGNSGANKTLSNLGTVAVNADILVDTDSTYDIGGTNYFAEGYFDKIYLTSTATMTGSAGLTTFDGGITVGADTDGYDVIFYATTTGVYLQWDASADSLILRDSTYLKFGSTSAISMDWDGTDFNIDGAADDSVVVIGEAHDLDVRFVSHDNAGYDCGWISDIYTFQICDNTVLHMGGTSFDTVDDGFTFVFDGTATLNIDAVDASDSMSIGENTVTDFELFGNANDILWDASEDELIFADNVEVIWGAGKDLQIESDGTLVNFILGSSIASINITGYGDQTTSIMVLDGVTNNWDGANDVGMLHLKNDVALANAGAAMLMLKSSGTPIASAEGYMARFESLDAGSTGTYAVQMYVDKNHVMQMETGGTCSTVLTLINETADTLTPMLKMGSSLSTFVGADDTGLVHIRNACSGAHVGATLLMVESTGVHVASAEGFMARFVDTGTALATAYGVEVEVATGTGALHCNGHALFDRGFQSGTVSIQPSTGTGGGGSTSVCAVGVKHFTVAGTTGADAIVQLPPAIVGREVWLSQSTGGGYELSGGSGVCINGGTGATGSESAIASSQDLVVAYCIGTTGWICVGYGSTGEVQNIEVSASG